MDKKTFSVPFDLGEVKENFSIDINPPSKSTKSTKPTQEQIINQAWKFHSEGNIKEAAKYYQYCIAQGFNDPDVFSNYGIILKNIGQLKEAENCYRKAIELQPDSADAYANLGNLLRDLGKLKEAELFTRKAIELNPDFANAYCNLGNILRDLGELKEAEVSLRKAIKLNPELEHAHLNLGNILQDLGNLKEALISVRKAIELNPDFANGYLNFGIILSDLGNLIEAEKALFKAFELDPQNKDIITNVIDLLPIYKIKDINLNPFFKINEEFRKINLPIKDQEYITDNEAIMLYRDGLNIYKENNLKLETNLSQIYKRNYINLDCKRHMTLFKQYKIIPEFCFGCYKVQVDLISIIELIKLFIVFNYLELENNNTRKCLIELRPNISGSYKGLIYCLGMDEAFAVSEILDMKIKKNIRFDLKSKVKRGCSEYPLEFPKYKEINKYGDQLMNYNHDWKVIENEFDKGNKEWGKKHETIKGFSLNSFLIIRNWISYAQKIGDESVNKITNEQRK